MAKSDYFPRPDGELLVWHDRFRTNIALHLAELGLTDADIVDVDKDNQELHLKIAASNAAAASARHATTDKYNSRSSIEARVRATVRRIKAHPGYTEALGKLLGIIGSEINDDLSETKPVLTAVDQTDGVVALSFQKYKSEGVNIYCQRENEPEFVFLARHTAPHYIDDRRLLTPGKPELRRYSAIFIRKDHEVGLFSDELVVTCSP